METSDENYSMRSDFLLILLVIGIFLLVSGIIVLIAANFSSRQESTSSGIIIFIGPIPIVIGSGPNATWLMTVALILTIAGLGLWVIMNKRSKKTWTHSAFSSLPNITYMKIRNSTMRVEAISTYLISSKYEPMSMLPTF